MIRTFMMLAMMACGVVFAAQTTYTNTYDFGPEGIIWDYKSGSWSEKYIGSNPVVEWSHDLPDSVLLSQLHSASLTIQGKGIDNIFGDWDLDFNENNDFVLIYLNDIQLKPNLTGNITTFDLDIDALKNINECRAELTFVFDKRWIPDIRDTVMLCNSTLNVNYESAGPIPAVVPVPGAAALGGIGIAVVGWLRTRKQ